jgi:hypothetical protein
VEELSTMVLMVKEEEEEEEEKNKKLLVLDMNKVLVATYHK